VDGIDTRDCLGQNDDETQFSKDTQMARTLPRSIAPVVEVLELEQAPLVTIEQLESIMDAIGLEGIPRKVAAELRSRGWLLATAKTGVWEFAPAAHAGSYGFGDPTVDLKAALLRRPDRKCALTFQSAAWAHGLADRVPAQLEVVVEERADAKALARVGDVTRFVPNLGTSVLGGVPVLAPESVLVHMATNPRAVRWQSAMEWMPDVAAEANSERILKELNDRPRAVRVRLGYLLQGVRPDIARLFVSDVVNKVWFGPRGKLRRHDQAWLIADTLLPLDPAVLPDVRVE